MTVSIKGLMLVGLLAGVYGASVPAFAQISSGPVAIGKSVTLDLDQAIARALQNSPALGAGQSRTNAASASVAQAGVLPNPEISIDVDNIYGDGSYRGVDNAEISYGISQLVELSGKRGNRIRVAEAEKDRIHYAYDGARLDLIRDVTIAYAELAIAQRDLSVIEEERNLAAEVRNSVTARVDAGKEPPIQKNKAEIELSAGDIALERARRVVDAKGRVLKILIGYPVDEMSIGTGFLPVLTEPQSFLYYRELLVQTPDAKMYDADIAQAQSALSLEKANSIPDPTFGFGMKQFREDDRRAFMAGVSLPIPVFNVNRAGIQRAGYELNAAKLEQRGGQLSMESALIEAYENFVTAYRTAQALEKSVLSGAEEAFSFSRQGYDAGKFGYLDVLDAQRTLFDARRTYNGAILDYYKQRAVIERMTAIHATAVNKE